MAAVRTVSLVKRFGQVLAVDHLELDVADGEFLVLLGPSGCGKTTTLRMIGGLETPTEGRVFVGERDVTDLRPGVRGCAMVFQDYALYPHMSVQDNLSFALRNLHHPRAEIDQRVREVAEILQIGALLERKPRELSGGQRQRVALGRAIVRHPDVYLFDEPLSNLDAKLRAAVRVELAELHSRLATTSIYVTHDQVEAMTLGTRVCLMDQGVVQQVGTGADLYDEPTNVFVASFIGSPPMNFVTGRVTKGDGLWVEIGDTRLAIPATRHDRYASVVGTEVTFGLRPEDIAVVTPRTNRTADAAVTVDLRVVENLGKETLVYFNLENQPVVASLAPENQPSVGTAHLAWNMDKMHLFDQRTGLVI